MVNIMPKANNPTFLRVTAALLALALSCPSDAASDTVTISGRIISNGPINGAQITIKDSSGKVFGNATSDPVGAYSITGNGSPPFMASVTDLNSKYMYGVSGGTTLNVSKLSSAMITLWYKSLGHSIRSVFNKLEKTPIFPSVADLDAGLNIVLGDVLGHLRIDQASIYDGQTTSELEDVLRNVKITGAGNTISITLNDGYTHSSEIHEARLKNSVIQYRITQKTKDPSVDPSGNDSPKKYITKINVHAEPGFAQASALNSSTNNDAWMSDLSGILSGMRLVDTPIPGTHDSGTSGITQPFAEPVSRTQTRTIGEQLEDGIRYFDLRVTENTHLGCADPSVFWLHHGENDSYKLSDAIQQLKAYLSNPRHSKEIVILDFQEVKDKYSDSRNTGVMFQYVQEQLAPYLMDKRNLAYALTKPNGSSNNLTFGMIWDFNNKSGQKGQVMLFGENRWVSFVPSGCKNKGGMIDYYWINRVTHLSSYYGERSSSSDLMLDYEAQLSFESAKSQGRTNLFMDYSAKATDKSFKAGLNVLQIVPRPNNIWYAAAATYHHLVPPTNLLEYGTFVNRNFNGKESCPTGWLAKRAWMAKNQPNGILGPWNKTNIIIADNYSKDHFWTNVKWDGSKWRMTKRGGYVDFVKELITGDPGNTTTPVVSFQDDQCLSP